MADVFVRIRAINETTGVLQRAGDDLNQFQTFIERVDGSARSAAREERNFSTGAIEVGRTSAGGARDVSLLDRALERTGESARGSGIAMGGFGGAARTALGVAAGVVGAGSLTQLAGGFKSNTVEALETGAAMTLVHEKLGLTGDATKGFDAQLRVLTASTGNGRFSLNEAANALAEVSNRTVGAEGSLGLLEHGMRLTIATGGNLQENTRGLNDVLKSWGLTATEAGPIAALLTQENHKTGASMQGLTSDLAVNGQAMARLGIPINEAIVVFGQLQAQGKGTGQDLITVSEQLEDQTGEQAKALQALGVDAHGADGKLRPLTEIFQEMYDEQVDLTAVGEILRGRTGTVVVSLVENWGKVEEGIDETKTAGEEYKDAVARIEAADHPYLRKIWADVNTSIDGSIKGVLDYGEALAKLGYEGKLVDFGKIGEDVGGGLAQLRAGPAPDSPVTRLEGWLGGTLGSLGRALGAEEGTSENPVLRLFGLAEGGIVPATPGGRPFLLAEGGKDEVVAPLDELARVLGIDGREGPRLPSTLLISVPEIRDRGGASAGTTIVNHYTFGDINVRDGDDLLSKLRGVGFTRRT